MMIKLRTQVQSILSAVNPRVYYQTAPESATMPYLVFDFSSAYDDGEEFQVITVDIDGWDEPSDGSTLALETLMASVNTALNKKTVITADLGVSFYLENKLSLQEADKRVKRRKYIYQARFWEVL